VREIVKIPVSEYNGIKWGALSYLDRTHEIIGEKFNCSNEKYSFRGQHRVRLYKVSGNVHFRIPLKAEFDISGVPKPDEAPRRQR
jgi:hypothetical protein